MAAQVMQRQFYLFLFDQEYNLKTMRRFTKQAWAPETINTTTRCDSLLSLIDKFRKSRYDDRKYLVQQERGILQRRLVLAREARQPDLFPKVMKRIS